MTITPQPFLRTYSEIDSLQSINGDSLEVINKRLQQRGYLQKGNNLKSCIKKDWETLRELGTTPQKLGELAQNFLKSMGGPIFNQLTEVSFNGQNIYLTYYCVREDEKDPFRAFPEVRTNLKIPSCWSDVALTSGESLKLSSGRLAMIRELGFFGDTAKERISPLALYHLLNG